MVARLGMVLYWAASAIAILLAIFAAFLVFSSYSGDKGFGIFLFVAAAIVGLIGRACLFVLAGR